MRRIRGVFRYGVLVLMLVLVPLSAMAAPQWQETVHVVQRGEYLTLIANRYGTTPQAIANANSLVNTNLIYVGQRLTIPGTGSTSGENPSYYTVSRGDTLSTIATRFGTTVQALVQANGLASADRIYVGQRLVVPGGATASTSGPSGSSVYYTVQRGDYVSSIAARHGVTAWAIVQANHLANPNFIYVGQRLVIPGGTAPAPAPAPQPSGGDKRIVIDLSEQRMYVYQGGQLLYTWVVSTGMPGADTITGHFSVLNKIPNAYAYTWGLQMPYWLGIYWAGSLQNGIHALPIMANGQLLWEGYLGQRVSYGCIILSTQNALTLYNWAPVGTPVDIQW
jgi:LysM repeat protein